jgi:antitoxin HicB
MKYAYTLEWFGNSFLIQMPDLPEAVSQADNEEEAAEMVSDAFTTTLEFYVEDMRKIPIPDRLSDPDKCKFYLPTVDQVIKIRLHNLLVESGMSYSEMFEKCGIVADPLPWFNTPAAHDQLVKCLGLFDCGFYVYNFKHYFSKKL